MFKWESVEEKVFFYFSEKLKIVKKFKLIYLFFFLNIFYVYFFGQVNARFDHLSIYDGLSQSSVLSILQDSRGYMWIGTQDGLNRYDGYNFKVLKHNTNNTSTISSNYILKIFEDRSDRIWIATANGLNLFSRKTETFSRFYFRDNDSINSKILLRTIIEDKASNLWIGTGNNGLIKFDPKTKKWVRYINNPEDSNSLTNNRILALCEGDKGEIWIGTKGGGLNRFDPKTGNFVVFKNQLNDVNSLSNNIVTSILNENSKRLLVGTSGGGINIYNKLNGQFKPFIIDKDDSRHSLYKWIESIYKDKEGIIWIGTNFGGLMKIISLNKGTFIHYKNNYLDKYSLIDDTIMAITEDKSGNIWFGTYLKGISIFKKQKQNFSHFYLKGTSKMHNMIRGIYEESDDVLWYGTLGSLIKYDRNIKSGDKIIYYNYDPKNPDSISGGGINCIYKSRESIWIGTTNGLNLFDRKTGKFKKYLRKNEDDKSIGSNTITNITEDFENNIWIGTINGGLNRYNHTSDDFTRFKIDPKNKMSIGSNSIEMIVNDYYDKDILWIGFSIKGLDRFDRRTGKFEHFIHDPKDRKSISTNYVLSVLSSRDNSEIVWVGTWGGGLNKFNKKTKKWVLYTEKNGLSNNTVYGILEDENNKLWLSTIKGISMFDTKTEEFKNYYEEDGLQSSEFNMYSSYRGESGLMYFGGINGFSFFNPKKIKKNLNIPSIIITAFKKSNKLVDLNESLSEIDEILLSYKDNVFSFEFAALEYTNPGNNKYAYKLEGFNKDWIYTDADNRVANFTNIPHGTYLFRVKGANNDNIWNKKGISIRLIISPPFWKTIWFKLILMSLFIVLIYYFHRLRLKKLTIKLQRENAINKLCLNYGISKREKEILDLVLSGKNNNEIVEKLSISIGTVKSHVHSIYNKVDVKKRNELYIKFSEV